MNDLGSWATRRYIDHDGPANVQDSLPTYQSFSPVPASLTSVL